MNTDNKKSIAFVLPGIPWKVSGGAKIVFNYSNKLVEKGYDITIYFLCTNTFSKRKLPLWIKKILVNIITFIFPSKKDLNKNIKKRAIFHVNDESIDDSDYIIATAWNTAFPVFNLSKSKGKKIYFIQDLEKWDTSEDFLYKTFSLMDNVVISSWLKKIVDDHSIKPCKLVPNAIDSSNFYISNPIENRPKYSIAALYHEKEHKGFKYLWQAIEELKKIYPQLEVKIFGMPQRPDFFPNWVEYTSHANVQELHKIYNSVSIYMCASINEGFGLTGAEAMACGCALVSSDYLGVHEYATHNVDALLSPVMNIDLMVTNAKKLIEDDDYRIKMANAGYKHITEYSIDNAVSLFEESITN